MILRLFAGDCNNCGGVVLVRHKNIAIANLLSKIRPLLQNKEAIFWDFDGTFCDTEGIHFRAYREAFRQFGHEVRESEYYLRFTHIGNGVAAESEAYGLDVDPSLISQLKKQDYARRIEAGEARLFPEILETLDVCRSLGVFWLVASNSPEEEIRRILRLASDEPSALQRQLIPPGADTLTVLGVTPQLEKKPAPDLFLESLRVAGVTAEKALVVEDTQKGLFAAAAAGIDAIWVRTPQNSTLPCEAPYAASLTHAELLAGLGALLPADA